VTRADSPPLQVRWAGLAVAIAVVVLLDNLLLSHPEGSVFHSIVRIGEWLRGAGVKPDVVTWPAWGYAWVVALLPRFDWIVLLQACLGTFALVALCRSLSRSMPRQVMIVAALCIVAIPWHDTQLTLYPSGFAGSLALLSLLSLEKATRAAGIRHALLAGVLMGLAANFRSEFVLLPWAIAAGSVALRPWQLGKSVPLRPLAIFVVVAFILQLPWAFFYHAETGRFSLTESNFGHVMFVSLGSDPNNPWKISGDDQSAMQAVRDQGYTFSSLSEQGNQVLRRLVWSKVKEHPQAVVKRTLQQLRNTASAPFNWGEPKLDAAAARDIDVLRQELKANLGVGVNVAKLNEYRSRDLYTVAAQDRAAMLALVYQIAAVGFGALIFLLGIAGMVLAVRFVQAPAQPLMWFLGCAALYKVLQDVLLSYQVNYLNNVYPVFLPFAALAVTTFGDKLRRRP